MSKRTDALFAALKKTDGRIVITGHDAPDVDSVISCVLMQRLLARGGMAARIVLPTRADAQARRVLARFAIDPDAYRGEIAADDCLVLVDHHRTAHAGRVIACVDHHPTDFPPAYPYTQIAPCGACGYMVYQLMREADAESRLDAVLAVAALYLDTIALRSTKISREEIAWAKDNAARLGMDEGWLEREGMGLMDMSRPAQELLGIGRKAYVFGGRRVISSYVQTDALTDDMLEQILDCIKQELERTDAALWVFLHHDPRAMRTREYDILPNGSVKEIKYDVLVSRGKDVMPCVEREMTRGEN